MHRIHIILSVLLIVLYAAWEGTVTNAMPRGIDSIEDSEPEQSSTPSLTTSSPKSRCLGKIDIQGSRDLHEDICNILKEEFTGKYLGSKEVQTEIRNAINKMYIQEGYLTSRVSNLDFQEGVLTIQIVEGQVKKIIIENESDLWLRPSFIRDRIGLGALDPLNTNILEESSWAYL